METSTETDSPMSDFKVPSLPFKSPASKIETPKTLSEDQKVPELKSEDTPSDTEAPEAPVAPAAPAAQYEEPSWGGVPPSDKLYSLEILKNGIIVDTVKLSGKSYFTVGR